MPLSLPLGFLMHSSEFPINRKTYKPDHMQTLSRPKPRQLLAQLASGEYPVHCESDKTFILRAVATTLDSLPPIIRLPYLTQ
jgi:hypothetical protein